MLRLKIQKPDNTAFSALQITDVITHSLTCEQPLEIVVTHRISKHTTIESTITYWADVIYFLFDLFSEKVTYSRADEVAALRILDAPKASLPKPRQIKSKQLRDVLVVLKKYEALFAGNDETLLSQNTTEDQR